ncbi:TPA: hypothetical protein JLH32_003282 [Escherichia coli]|nr:hypothetical protein [Escherichia coli]HAV7660129.1 hypothetical protein [Escherichia coli]HAV9784360.1 hypothetical protein [Escherichia coli]
MKQMTLIEMDGFLKGKCIPCNLKVNETNAEYLVRKFAEAEAKCAALAAENAALKQSEKEFNNFCRQEYYGWEDNFTETPATDAFLTEVRAKAFDDLCAAFVKHASVSGLDDGDCVTVKEATDALLHCAEQLHKGVHS